MAEEIIYNSEEVIEAANTLQENEKLFNDEIKKSLTGDFNALSELGFTGLSKLQSQADSLINSHNLFIDELKDHDVKMIDFEDSQDNKIKEILNDETFENTENTAKIRDFDDIDLDSVNQNEAIPNSVLEMVLPQFSYTTKAQVLKSIKIFDAGSVTSLLTNESKSNILVYELKQILNDDASDISTFATEEEKDVQKTLLGTLSDEKKNIFKEIDEDTFLRGIPYYKKIADLNNISVADLIIDEKNNNLLSNCIKFICEHYSVEGMDQSDVASVKNYINALAKGTGATTANFLSSKNSISIIRGGNDL